MSQWTAIQFERRMAFEPGEEQKEILRFEEQTNTPVADPSLLLSSLLGAMGTPRLAAVLARVVELNCDWTADEEGGFPSPRRFIEEAYALVAAWNEYDEKRDAEDE